MSQETSFWCMFWAKSKPGLGLAVCLGLWGLAAPAAASRIVAYPGFPLGALGHEVNLADGQIGAACLTGTAQLVRRPSVQAKLHFNQSSEELFSHVFGTGSAGINAGIIGAKKALRFSKQLGLNDQRATLVLEINYHHGDMAFKHPARLSGCDGPCASSLRIGARFLVGVALEFSSRDQKDRFVTKTTVSALWGAVKKSKTHVDEIERFTSNARLKVHTLLLGGKSEALDGLGYSMECPPDLKAPCFDYGAKVLNAFAGTDEFATSVQRSLDNKDYYVTSIVVRP